MPKLALDNALNGMAFSTNMDANAIASDRATTGAGIENNIGTINIASEVDGEAWLRKLSGNQEITANNLTPVMEYI
jgi:hypothetical protein